MQKGRKDIHPLKKARLHLGYTQVMLADFTQVGIATIQRAERGEVLRPDTVMQICNYFGECYKRPVLPQELGLIWEADETEQSKYHVTFEPSPYPYLGYSHLQKSVGSDEMVLRTARFLTLTADELIERYAHEEPLQLTVNEFRWTLPQICVFNNSAKHFPLSSIKVQLDTEKPQYAIPTKIEAKAKDILEEVGHFFHDSTTIRLNKVIQDRDDLTLVISKAHYLNYVATNYAMDSFFPERGWTKPLRDIIHPEKKLEPLETSLLANHIGIGVLVFTSDDYLIIPVRSHEKVGIWQKQISPSISGATSYDDDMIGNAKMGLIATWMREGREELGLENSHFTDESIFLGITRELLRGGKPEFFFATRISLTKSEVEQRFHKARDRWENKELRWFEFSSPLKPFSTMEGKSAFIDEFLLLIDQYQSLLSQPMQANLTLWFNYMMSSSLS